MLSPRRCVTSPPIAHRGAGITAPTMTQVSRANASFIRQPWISPPRLASRASREDEGGLLVETTSSEPRMTARR
jgi:hypothetical protein